MNRYSIHIEIDQRSLPPTEAIRLVDDLAKYHAAVGLSPRGWVDFQLSVPGDRLDQAVTTAVGIIQLVAKKPIITVTAMTEAEFDRRQGHTPTPELIGATEAASILGVSRQRVAQMVDEGKLAGEKIGGVLVLVRSEVQAKTR